MQCVRCGADNEAQFRFCPQCGLRLGEGSESAPLTGERKLVTVLFCDLIDSTAIAERLDPEEYSDLLEQYIHRAFAEVYRLDGHVNQLAGDGFMALFGAPVAHEDAPERGVRAALAVQRAIADLANRRTPVKARIGVHTGPVVVGSVGTDRRMDYTAIGDTTNLAARLESMAAPGAILMSEATHRLVRGRFHVRATGPLAIKGKTELVSAYEVLGEAGDSGAIELAAARGLTPLIGRAQEVAELEHCFSRTCCGERQVAAIVGEAGSGKSRLVYEFQRRFDSEPVCIFEGRCASLNQTTPFYPFITMFRRHFGIQPTDTAEQAIARVREHGENAMTPEQERTSAMLTAFLVDPSYVPSDISAEELKSAVYMAVEKGIRSHAEECPTLVIVEDVHWIDESSRELLEHLTRSLAGTRSLVIITHRPQDEPVWRPRVPVLPIQLRRLADADVLAIMRAVAAAELPPGLETRLVRRAAGSPFFAEELVRGLVESGALRTHDGVATLSQPLEQLPIPDTVQEVIAARLDRLPATVKRVAQVAAVLGRQFSARQLAQVLDGEDIDVAQALVELERRGLVHRKGSLEGDTLRFGESLTQEIAYESLLLKQRRVLHERVATVIESGGAESAQSGLLAYHYARSENRPKAVAALLHSAQAAERVPSYDVAARLYREAWDLAEEELKVRPSEAMARAAYSAVGVLCRLLAMFGLGDVAAGERMARRALELAEELGDTHSRPTLHYFEGVILMMQGREHFTRGLAQAEEAFAEAQRGQNPSSAVSVARGLCFSYIADGRLDVARRTVDWVVAEAIARDGTNRPSDFQIAVRWLDSVVRYAMDDLDAGQASALTTYALSLEYENRTVQCVVAATIAQVEMLRGRFAAAQEWADIAVGIADEIGNVAAFTPSASVALTARLAQGRAVDPQPYVDLIERGLTASGPSQINFRFVSEALLAGGADPERAERLLSRTRDLAGGRLREAIAAIGWADLLRHRDGAHGAEAERLYHQAVALAEACGMRSLGAEGVVRLAELQRLRGDHDAAARDMARVAPVIRSLGLGYLDWRMARLTGRDASAQPSA